MNIPGGKMSGPGMIDAIVKRTDAAQAGQANSPASCQSAARIDVYFGPRKIAGAVVVFAFRPFE